jgi:hypothetical protein
LYFYVHHTGHGLPEKLREALVTGWHWDDPLSLAGHIMQVIFPVGISTWPADNEYPFLVVDVGRQTVSMEDDPRPDFRAIQDLYVAGQSWSFDEFVRADEADIQWREKPGG